MSAIKKLTLLALLLMLAAAPALAQENTAVRVGFGSFSFSPDPALAGNVNIVRQPADVETTFPPQPAHTAFYLYNGMSAPFSFADSAGTIFLYRIADLPFAVEHQQQAEALRILLAERPDLATLSATDAPLPFLPVFPAGQVIRARTAYAETPAMTGIRFVTAYAQAQEPFLADSFLYTFQGISADGQYLISILIPLTAGMFPAEPDPSFGVVELQADVAGYMLESAALLNDATPGDFSPTLDVLDALVDSIVFAE